MDLKAPNQPNVSEPLSAGLEAKQQRASAWFEELRNLICASLEAIEDEAEGLAGCEGREAGRFVQKPWTRTDHAAGDGGGGVMALMSGRVFEKAGCHTSTVHGTFAPEFAEQIPGADQDPRFWASGISFIAHPVNPNAPTAHMNTRMVVTSKGWFGGGGDLTPLLAHRRTQQDQDSRDFHAAMKAACDGETSADYARFKRWCDEYFYLPHRGEMRGIGGIFFDELRGDLEATFTFVRDCGAAFMQSYEPIARLRRDERFGERERAFQLYRRGRYVEFNLLYDRGTSFGLATNGRTESILMSLPPLARWQYGWVAQPGSREEEAMRFLQPRDWAT